MSTTQTQVRTRPAASKTIDSKTIDHITSYPVVSSSIETFKAQPLGRKSLDLTQTGYNNVVLPLIPYAKGPYGYVAPYVTRADQLANSGLDKVDARFPVVKTQPEAIKSWLLSYAAWPFQLADQTKSHVLDTYASEYDKCGAPSKNQTSNKNKQVAAESYLVQTMGEKYFVLTKAAITTSLILTSETLAWFSAFVSARRDESSQYASAKYAQGREYAASTKDYMQREGERYVAGARERVDQARSLAVKKGEEVRRLADEKIGNGKVN